MSVFWIVTLINSTEQNRKMTLLAWIALIAAFTNIYFFVSIVDGTVPDHYCKETFIANMNSVGIELTAEACKTSVRNLNLV